MSTAVTLFALDQRLYAMLRKRQAMVDELIVDPASAAIRDAEVSGLDRVIDRHIADLTEAKKVDGRAYVYKQFINDAGAHKKEGDRLLKLAKSEQAAADRIRERAAEYLRQRVEEKDPAAIINSTPGTYIDSIDGQYNTIHLVKNPDGVDEPIDMSLLPEVYRHITITMSEQVWQDILLCIRTEHWSRLQANIATLVTSGAVKELDPDKRAILAALKQRVPCDACDGLGDKQEREACPQCGGSGTIPGSVPGAHLKHGVHVRIS